MGPVIILDKTALQGLSAAEIVFLHKHFWLNIPPILPVEILADLKKPQAGGLTETLVQELAGKLLIIDSAVNIHYRALCFGSLLGNLVPMSRQIIIPPGRRVVAKDGSPGILFEDPPIMEAIQRWGDGRFTEAEQLLATAWRVASDQLDPSVQRGRLARHHLLVPTCRDLADAGRAVAGLLGNEATQEALILWLLEEYASPEEMRQQVMGSWHRKGQRPLRDFAPYAAFCARVELCFLVAVRDGLIGVKASNRLDLEYCFYLPFCMAFASTDRLHGRLAPLFLDADQDFVPGQELKSDLKRISDEWAGLDAETKKVRELKYGFYPPPHDGSIVHKVWRRHMRPWEPGMGNSASQMTEEERARVLDELRPIMDAIKELDESEADGREPR